MNYQKIIQRAGANANSTKDQVKTVPLSQKIQNIFVHRGFRSLLLLSVWAVRLSVYLTWRNWSMGEGFL